MAEQGAVSARLDGLATTLIGEALDALAETGELGVVASVVDAADERLTFGSADAPVDEGLEWARSWVEGLAAGTLDREALREPVAWAICYLGAVAASEVAEDAPDAAPALSPGYHDALICEFGEKGAPAAWSSYQLVSGLGKGDDFAFTDPLPAGEVEPLI